MRPLDARHLRAAALLGRGARLADVAEEVGVTPRTISDWRRREDFREAEAAAAARHEAEAPSAKTMRAVLEEAALTACRPESDEPDWPTRVRAAAALTRAEGFGAPPEPPPPELEFIDGALDDNNEGEEVAPAPIDLAAAYTDWDGVVSEREANEWTRTGATFGGGWA